MPSLDCGAFAPRTAGGGLSPRDSTAGVTRRSVPLWIRVYRIVTGISSSRNIRQLEMKYGSARLRYADPFRRALGIGHQPRARGHLRVEGKPLPAFDSAGRHL